MTVATAGATPTGCFPGSFNPLTVAHLAMAEAAVDAFELERLDLVVSEVALGKGVVARPQLDDRMAVLAAAADARRWLGVRRTGLQLLAEIAQGYDVLVLGADKWEQVLDPVFYGGSAAARDAAVASLPAVALARRHGAPVHEEAALPPGSKVLDLPEGLGVVSSSGVRGDAALRHWMAPEAEAFDAASGAWSSPERYDAWLAAQEAER